MTQPVKDTGVSWIGQIPSEWSYKRLKFAVTLINEKIDAVSEELPYVGLEHVTSWTGQYFPSDETASEGAASKFYAGDVLFGKLRPYLAKSFVAVDCGVASTELLVMRPNDEVDAKFFNYYLLSEGFVNIVDSSTYGAKMPRANWEFIGNLPMLIPSPYEQQKIVEFLEHKTSQIDALIEKKRALIEKLNEKRTAVITQAVTKGLDPGVPMKDSGVEWLGEVPEHWEIRRLKFMATIQNGRDYKHIESSEGYPVIGSGGRFATASEFLYEGQSVLFGRKGTIDKPLYFEGKFWTVDTMFYSFVQPETMPMHLYFCALTIQYKFLATQTALPSVTQHDLENYLLCSPPLEEQQMIVGFVTSQISQIDQMIVKTQETISRLSEYRSSLITAAVTGQIDVRDFGVAAAVLS